MASVPQFDYVNEFNSSAKLYLKCRTETSENVVNRSLTVSSFLFKEKKNQN